MKALTAAILSVLLMIPAALTAYNGEAGEGQILEEKYQSYLHGQYHGFTFGTPGALDFHVGYMGEKAGVSISASTLAVAVPVTFLCNTFIFLDSGNWSGENSLRYFNYYSGQGNFFINISRERHSIFAFSLFGGGVYYSLENKEDKVAMVYGGVAVNWFYKNLYVQAGVAYTHHFTKRISISKYPVLPSIQVGYVFQF